MIIPFPQVTTPGSSSMMNYVSNTEAVQNTTVLAYIAPSLYPFESLKFRSSSILAPMNLGAHLSTQLPIFKPQPPNHKPYGETGFWISIVALAALLLAVTVFYVKAYKDKKAKSAPKSDCRWDEMAPNFQVYREVSSPRRGPIDKHKPPPPCITPGDSRLHRAQSIEGLTEGRAVDWKKILVVE